MEKRKVNHEKTPSKKMLGTRRRLSNIKDYKSILLDSSLSNILNKRALSCFQIIMLIISIMAFAYIISESFVLVDAVEGLSCCEKTKQGAYCQYTLEEDCDSAYRDAPTECEYVDYCKPGCCYSTQTGICNKATPEILCEDKWSEDANCNIPECSRGCCLIGRNALFTTDRNCEVRAKFYGVEKDFRPEIGNELECIFLADRDEEGACVYGTDCSIATKESCINTGGKFYKGKYCSDPSLETDCEAHDHAGCYEQKVYWFDSCGNREEVKEECSIFTGTICALQGSDYRCKSIDCQVDINGKSVKKKNGESWCEYEGTIGQGRDVPGSRHIRHICFMGEERTEPCQDYRNQICVQSDTEIGGITFTEAACRVNNWRQCLNYNTEKDKDKMKERCGENPDCYLKNVDVDEYFSFTSCVPNYPPGFDLSTDIGGKSAELVCSMGSQKCTYIEVKQWDLSWDCEVNCDCKDAEFAQKMNEFCTSLGDCGAYTNVVGEVTDDGYTVSRAPKLSTTFLRGLSKFSDNIPGQKAEPGNLSFLYGGTDILSRKAGEDYDFGNALGAGALGFMLGVLSNLPHISGIGAAVKQTINFGVSPDPLGAFANVLGAAGAVMAGASLISLIFDIDYNDALAIAGGTVGGYLTYVYFQRSIEGVFEAMGQLFWIGIIIIVVFFALTEIIGIGDTREKTVTFNCYPWQAPLGGEDCSKCNEFTDCSQYKCDSLGQGCKLINKGTDQQRCVDVTPGDVSSPRISPLYDFITEGYEYSGANEMGFELKETGKSCIPEFTTVLFGVKTDRPSQCKIGADPLENYDQMSNNYFGGSNLYVENHTSVLVLPSLEALKNEYNLTPVQVDELGEFNFYVKCRGINGKANDAAYVIKSCAREGPDLTAPMLTRVKPEKGYIGFNTTEFKATFWINEPANCRYSISFDKKYVEMENQMVCQNSLEDEDFYGFPCNVTFNVENQDRFFIKCQDLSENQNTMTNSQEYKLTRSSSELRIVLTDPANEEIIRVASEPATVKLEVLTAGGAEDGKAKCSYKLRETAQYAKFLETNSNRHQQTFNSVMGGEYSVWIECVDAAENLASTTLRFTIYVDEDAPGIARVYYENGLKIVTNEDATCVYSFADSRCSFDVKEGENVFLAIGTGKEHTLEWQTENTYYIKCMDKYGNKPGRCSIVVRPYNLL